MLPLSSARAARPKVKLALLILLLPLVIALTVKARAWFMPRPKLEVATVPAPQETGTATSINSLHLTLRTTGFEPAEITGHAGRFLLAVDNKTETDDVTVQLTDASGARLREVAMPLNKTRWREVVNLPAGNYTLAEINHSAWVCHITLTEQ